MIKQPEKYQDFNDPQAQPRYTGIATFFRTPASQQLADVDIGIIGVPFDGGVTNRTGTRHPTPRLTYSFVPRTSNSP